MAAVLATFMPSVANDFVDWDDLAFVVKNIHIGSLSTESLWWMCTTFYQGIWHPLTWLSHGLAVAAWGQNPAPHHFVNVLLHTINVGLFFLLCVRLQNAWNLRNPMGRTLSPQRISIAAFTAALLFGVHPLRVEAVAWLSARKDVLCALFFLSTLISYVSYTTTDRTGYRGRMFYLLSIFLCFAAVLSKPVATTVPAVLLLLDYYPLYRLNSDSWRACLWEKIPFFVLSAISLGLNIGAQAGTEVPLSYVSADMRIMNAFHSMVSYLVQSVAPQNLLPLYAIDRTVNYFGPVYLVCLAVVLCLTAASAWRAFRSDRLWIVLWAYYVVTLAPVSGLIMTYRHSAADRYTYVSTLSFWLLAGLGAGRLWEAAGSLKRIVFWRVTLALFIIAVATAYVFKTEKQIDVWQNTEALWTYVLTNSASVPDVAFFAMGKVCENRGDLERALSYYRAAMALNPANSRYRARIADVLAMGGEPERALKVAREILEMEPDSPSAHATLGRILGYMGRYDTAIEEFLKALKIDADCDEALAGLVLAYLEKGDRQRAMEYFRRCRAKGFEVPHRDKTGRETRGIR